MRKVPSNLQLVLVLDDNHKAVPLHIAISIEDLRLVFEASSRFQDGLLWERLLDGDLVTIEKLYSAAAY